MWMLDTPFMIVAGLLTGVVFGVLLQKAHVTRYEVIVGQFLFKDFTVLKVMLTAIVVGAVGVYGMLALGLLEPANMHIKALAVLGNVLGGAIFGVGMALLGYCPGTGVAALGDGSRHAWFGVLGMLVGGAAYAHFYPAIESHILSVGTYGKQTLPTLTGVSPWWYVAGVAVLAVVVFVLIEKFGPRTRMPHAG